MARALDAVARRGRSLLPCALRPDETEAELVGLPEACGSLEGSQPRDDCDGHVGAIRHWDRHLDVLHTH